MPIAVGVLWAIMTVNVIHITIKYYLPRLLQTRSVLASKVQNQIELQENEQTRLSQLVVSREDSVKFITTERKNLLLLIGGGIFAVLCGYYAGVSATTWISLIKMTLTFCVLACACITDLEFFLIPNLCPVVLVAGRLIIGLLEWIYLKEEAILWFSNSVIALVITLVFMLFASKITKGGIGMGDVKLFSALGFVCGIQTVCFTLVIAFTICAFVSFVLLVSKKMGLKDALPMGPFIWIGFGITVILRII